MAETTTTGAYNVVRADIKTDRETIIELIARNEPAASFVREQVVWNLEHNPHGEGRVWLLLNAAASSPVGVVLALPRRVFVAGEVRPAARLWTIAVDKEHRTLGPALTLLGGAWSELQGDTDLVWAVPHNQNATSFLTRIGFKKLVRLERRVRALCSKEHLNRILRPVAPALSPLIVPWLAPVADRIARLVVDRHRSGSADLEISWIAGFDHQIDELWARARTATQLQFTTERTAEFLRWRFRRSWETHITLGFRQKADQRLFGYAVLRLDDDRTPILEDLFLQDSSTLTGPALTLLVQWLQARGFQSLITMYAGNADVHQALTQRWFVQRPSANRMPLAKDPLGGSRQTDPNEFTVMVGLSSKRAFDLPNVSSWHFTLADDI